MEVQDLMLPRRSSLKGAICKYQHWNTGIGIGIGIRIGIDVAFML